MRGGVFVDDDRVERADLLAFARTRNRAAASRHAAFFEALPATRRVQWTPERNSKVLVKQLAPST